MITNDLSELVVLASSVTTQIDRSLYTVQVHEKFRDSCEISADVIEMNVTSRITNLDPSQILVLVESKGSYTST